MEQAIAKPIQVKFRDDILEVLGGAHKHPQSNLPVQ